MFYKIGTVILLIVFSSCTPVYLTQQEKEVVYSYKVEVTKEQIRIKLLQFINETFKSSKAVIQVNEDGLLSGNGVVFLSSDAIGLIKTYMEFTFMFKYEDNQYKVKCLVKNLYNVDHKSTYDLAEHQYGNYKEKILAEFAKFDKSVNDYLTNKNNSFDF